MFALDRWPWQVFSYLATFWYDFARRCILLGFVMPSSHHRHRQDKTVLSCLVLSVSAVWTELATSQDCRRQKISKLNMFSFLQFCPVSKCGVNWALSPLDPVSSLQLFSLKYIEGYWKLSCLVSCRQFSSHRRHGQEWQDSLVLSVSMVWTRQKLNKSKPVWLDIWSWQTDAQSYHSMYCALQ